MRWAAAALFFFQAFLAGTAIWLGIWAGLPALGTAGLALLALSLMAGRLRALPPMEGHIKARLAAVWVLTLLAPCAALLAERPQDYLDPLYGLVAWVVAASFLATNPLKPLAISGRLRLLAMVLALFANTFLIGYAYSINHSVLFHAALALMVVWIILVKAWHRPPDLAVQLLNTGILLCIGLPLADLFVRPSYRMDTLPETGANYYSYERARQNPRAFELWWRHYLDQWNWMAKVVFEEDPTGRLPFLLRPGAEAMFFQSKISINSRGFRGKEFRPEKGDAYRIVALGESTTFGCTLGAADETWPALLESLIRERLKPARPVEVINAGVPSYTLEHNLMRFEKTILPLQPDMVISYHGYNGFNMALDAVPSATGKAPPHYNPRPLKILADCEYRARILSYRRSLPATPTPSSADEQTLTDPMRTRYADCHRALYEICRTNHIRLVLATFSMAVNSKSEADLIEFYRAPFPKVYTQIRANNVLSQVIRGMAQEHPDILVVATRPHLGGKHEFFTDLVHFTQAGRDEMAEVFFEGITNVLEGALRPGGR